MRLFLLHLLVGLGPAAIVIVILVTVVIIVFVAFLGIAMWATLRAKDPEQRDIRYKIFRDLLGLFRYGLRLLLSRRRR